MTTLPLGRYLEKARRLGPAGAARRVWERASERVSLEGRALSWALREARLPSDRTVLDAAGGSWADIDQFVEHLCRKESPAFLFSPTDRDDYVRVLRDRLRPEADRALRLAEGASQHRFQVLGRTVHFDDRIDWHIDPDTWTAWPRVYYERFDDLLWSGRSTRDSKLVWELNRHQHLVTLGKAYWLTHDERYARECAEQVLAWIEDNPAGMGINWYSALEVGLRLVSWCLAFHFVRSDAGFVHHAGRDFVKSLYQQARFLRRHLSADWPVPNNHLIGEAVGLVLVGAMFPEFTEADDWLATGIRLLEWSMMAQVHADGASQEQTTGYHRFVMELVSLPVVLGERGAIPDSPVLVQALERMLNYAMLVTAPDGSVPALGDADDGAGIPLVSGTAAGYSGLLSLGAVLFGRPDLKYVSGEFGEGALWLLGPKAARAYDRLPAEPPATTSVTFPDSGHQVLRSDWSGGAGMAFMRCGPFGLGGEGFCAHAHCDLLSPALWLRGRRLLIDPGTYSYHGPWRDRLRTTGAHNTLMVDGVEQARTAGEFSWVQVPQATCIHWDPVRRSVTGRMAAAPGVRQERAVRLEGPGACRIIDRVSGAGEHRLAWRFHLAPGLDPHQVEGRTMVVTDGSATVARVAAPDGVRLTTADAWASPAYGEKQPCMVVVGEWQGQLNDVGTVFEWSFAAIGEIDREQDEG